MMITCMLCMIYFLYMYIFQFQFFRAAKRCLCGCKLLSVLGTAAGSQCTDRRKPASFYIQPNHKYHESYGCARIQGARDSSVPLWFAFTASARAERSVGNYSPANVFPLPTSPQLLLQRPSSSMSQASLKVSVLSILGIIMPITQLDGVIYTTRLWGGPQPSHICHPATAQPNVLEQYM